MQVDAEAGLEVLVHHHGSLRVHDRGAGQTALDGLEDLLGLNAALLAEGHGLRHRRDVHGHDDLVAQLGHVARADAAAEHHGGTHLLEEGLDLLKDLRLAADHECQRAVNGLGFAAGNRSVHHLDAHLLQLRVDFAGGDGVDGGAIQHDGALLQSRSSAVLAEQGFLDVGGIGNHGDEDVHLLGHVRIGLRSSRAHGDQLFHRRLGELVGNNQLIAGLDQVLCHGLAHDAQADKSNFHFCFPPVYQ